MQIYTFLAESAADAITQIRSQLGPTAVVVNVRRRTGDGFSRLWQKSRIEVLAYVPESVPAPPPVPADHLSELRDKLAVIEQQISTQREAPNSLMERPSLLGPHVTPRSTTPGPGQWRMGVLLENSGLLPIHAQRVVEELRSRHGDTPPPEGLSRELELAGQVLTEFWERKPLRKPAPIETHILIGAAGVGKTTCICKWLAEEVLLKNRRAAVWRLDSRVANTAEVLSVYCDILGVPVNRLASDGAGTAATDIRFIDLPGVNWNKADELKDFGTLLSTLPEAQLHLVVNGAYETPHLLAQARVFDSLPISDIIVTHLDEEARWGKLWNLVLGTKYSLRYLSVGQNIPGDLTPGTPQKLLQRQFSHK